VLCAVIYPVSLSNVFTKWLSEVVVGTQKDKENRVITKQDELGAQIVLLMLNFYGRNSYDFVHLMIASALTTAKKERNASFQKLFNFLRR
jgi:hypothetical protein